MIGAENVGVEHLASTTFMGSAGTAGAANSTHQAFVPYCGVVGARWFVAGSM